MRDLEDYRIDFLMIHVGLTEQQATERVQAEREGRAGQPEGPPSPEEIFISFHPFYERRGRAAELYGDHQASWQAVWTAATKAGSPNMSDVIDRFESTTDSPDEAISWAQERCANSWILPRAETTEITVEEYLGRG
ncbi:hypothetical protein Caci_6565 [Catenulispora acidiphila DSM 44928]|uniref:Uncharacterized protein n=1 Tax=Catenulispora acidiphila (strain DSM 44928 / JCM 14897 / NBRC 102108 / NRRL B-24433 / ID139908) TaxID=479433 RepID=C7PYC1_CATAD|nr:hypothetical protein [Catenulispora acidiphila]ACU75411.1 hypothetical protein Caci_6565 [Catenulispora acidiphila DSM 44928]